MISWLTNATKKKVIELIRGFMLQHPKYKADAENVQNKFSFAERPARGVIVNGVSADRVKLSADNYMGRLHSFVMQTDYNNKPNTTVEWVRENNPVLESIQADRRVFPVDPGVYLFKVLQLPDDSQKLPGYVQVQPIISVYAEEVIHFLDSGFAEATLTNSPIYPGSVRLYLHSRALLLDVDYSVDYESGLINFLKQGPVGASILADYKYLAPSIDQVPFRREEPDVKTIPGAIIAYGDRAQIDDEWAVVISEERKETAEVYGGKFEISFDLLAFSKDAEDREKLSDYLIMKILESQNRLGFDGFELLEVNPGGENEDVFNPETDEYYYESNISMQLRVDWSIYVPLPIEIFRIEATSKVEESEKGYLDGTYTMDQLKVLESSGMVSIGRSPSYERIS